MSSDKQRCIHCRQVVELRWVHSHNDRRCFDLAGIAAASNQVGQPAGVSDGIAQGGLAGRPAPDADVQDAGGARPGPDGNDALKAASRPATVREESPVLGVENHGASYAAADASQAPLTDERLEEMWEADTTSGRDCESLYFFKVVARAVERAHGIEGLPLRECANGDCGWRGTTNRMLGAIGPLCPECGEITEAA